MNKQEIRKIYSQRRRDLIAPQRMKLDDLLLIQLQRLSLPAVDMLLSYWPFEKHAEVNTHLFTRYLQFALPQLRTAYPVIDPVTLGMSAVLVDDDTEFEENVFGIPEPPQSPDMVVLPAQIDLVFVPLLAYDNKGVRVGYGKGFYDRFLNECRSDVCKVGFSYFEPVDTIDDTHEYDVPLNFCITPERIYEF